MSHSAVRPLPPLVGQVGLELEIALCVGGVISPFLANIYLDVLDDVGSVDASNSEPS